MKNKPIKIADSEIQPWHSLGGEELICELTKSSMVLYGIFTELLRYIYSNPEGRLLGTPSVCWRSQNTEIWIDSELRWEDQHPEFRPAIYVQLSPYKSESTLPVLQGRYTGYDRFGVKKHSNKIQGAVTFMHVASTAGEACSLADNTEHTLTLLQDVIREDFCFHIFSIAERQPLVKLPAEASAKYGSAVTFAFAFEKAWEVKKECPVLKAIDFSKSNGHTTVAHANIFTEKKVSGNPGK